MPQEPANGNGPADRVRARIAATNQLLARSRQRATQAMAHAAHARELSWRARAELASQKARVAEVE
jgi:hypothetical protein